MEKFKMQIILAIVKKMVPYALTAAGSFLLATYPDIYQGLCVL